MRSIRPLLLLAALAAAPVATAGQPPSIAAGEYAARRARVAEALGPDALLVLVAPEPAVRNGDVTWPFRQDDDLLYLTGVDLPGTALALVPGEETHREVLFAPAADPAAALWTGPVPGFEALAEASGIEEVVAADLLRPFLAAALSGLPWGETELYRYYRPPGLPHFAGAARQGRARVWLDLGPRRLDADPPTPALRLAHELRETWPDVALGDATPLLSGLREVKSPAEVALLERATAITAEGIRAAMRRALTAEGENQVQATLEATFRDLGACCWGFPSIVAAGPNATILHYEAGEAPLARDGLVLLDVGAEVAGYTADISRTFPADGTFSDAQRALYQAVLDVWEALLPRLRPGARFADLHQEAVRLLGEELLGLGLVAANVPEQVTLYFPHGLGHPLGLQVHDVFDRTRILEEGMVWTLEPGLYVRPDAVTASPAYTALAEAEQAAVRAALERYAGLGVRIEDDVLITAGAPRVLSAGAPRGVDEIEAWMAAGR